MRCSRCGSLNSADAAFCGECGVAIRGQNGVAPPTPAAIIQPRQSSLSDSDSTRYLCAAVHLDSVLAERLIREILDEEYKASPPSPDVDLVPVLRNALSARQRHLVRDVAISILFFVFLGLAFAYSLPGALIGLVFIWLVILAERLVATYGVLARDFGPGHSASTLPSRPASLRAERRLSHIAASAGGNVTVYGSYMPFVGSGVPLDAWSFALDIERAAEGRQVESFTTQEIHDFVLAQLRSLEVARVIIDDRVFVDGRDLRGDGRFLAHELAPPASHVDPSLVRALLAEPEERARPYLCLRVSGWRGQLVLSTFLRFVVTGNNLFVELSHSLLTPILAEYQDVDRLLPEPSFGQLLRIAGRCLIRVPAGVVIALGSVPRAMLAPLSRQVQQARQRREITSALRFNYGATSSPREMVSDPRYHRYFQQLDKELYSKVVEKRLLQAITTFLDAMGVDTGELVERQTTILNQGVYVTGGTVTAESIAAGAGAKAKSAVAKVRTAAERG